MPVNEMKTIRTIRNFDLRQIAESGQCFRMTELSAAEAETLWRAAEDQGWTEEPSAEAPVKSGGGETTRRAATDSSRTGEPFERGPVESGGEETMQRTATDSGRTGEPFERVPVKSGEEETTRRTAIDPGRTEELPAGVSAKSGSGETTRRVTAHRIVSGSRVLTAAQAGERTAFFCGDGELAYWEEYFDLGTDYGRMIASVDPQDGYLRRAAEFGGGIRILRQDVWEMIITFVISQQKTIPNIRALVEALCARYGTRIGREGEALYAFPTPRQLNEAELSDLLELKLGYRAKYIKRICGDACSGALDLERLRRMDYPAAMAYLRGFYGIGEKVANCVCLFGLHQIEAFPIDTWIRKILLREYLPGSGPEADGPKTGLCARLAEKHFARYAGYAGVLQQYMFYYERRGGDCGATK